MQFLLSILAAVFRWLLAGLLGRLVFSVISQGLILVGALWYGGAIAEWAAGKMASFVRSSSFAERLGLAFGQLGGLPADVLQLWGCLGAREVFVAFLGGQISAIGIALIARKLL